MKKALFSLTFAALFSSSAFADKSGAYIGADIGSNYVGSYYLDNHIGLVAGYDFQLSPKVVVGIEGEYRNMGSDSAFDGTSSTSIGADVSASYYALISSQNTTSPTISMAQSWSVYTGLLTKKS